jgi:hypothetical protein
LKLLVELSVPALVDKPKEKGLGALDIPLELSPIPDDWMRRLLGALILR